MEHRLPDCNETTEAISKILVLVAKELRLEAAKSAEEFTRTYREEYKNIDALVRFREIRAKIDTLRQVAYHIGKEHFEEYEQNDISSEPFLD
jgi:hypothetical protein